MGDRQRFKVLADWIRTQYPQARNVADVAGGGGRLFLHIGLTGAVIDPRHSGLSKSERRAQRRGYLPQIEYRHTLYTADQAEEFDLIVGLHPDGATAEIAASALKRPVCVVPCCNYGWNMPGDPANLVREYWSKMGVSWQEHVLPMAGRNLIMYTG